VVVQRSIRRSRSGSPNGIAAVVGWELRRLAASPGNLGLVGATFAFFVALVWFKHSWAIPVETGTGRGAVLNVMGSTALGTVFEVVALLLLFFGMLVPFVVADAVARDQRQRVHELLMATPISTAAYVWGRFLASFGVALMLSIVMVVAVAAADATIHLSDPTFPGVNLAALAVDWAVLVVPAVAVIGGLGFMLSTLMPRMATAAKVSVLLLWVMLTVVVDIGHGLGWFGYWTPTGNGVLKVVPQAVAAHYADLLLAATANASDLAIQVQQQTPDLWPWVAPHAGLVALGAAFATIAAIGFRRFQNSLG
jgi:ABC-type transport system involved in multi-copper enzyme maturation permease subunit